ncbi:hypothetical protein BZG01_08795 [Labilibaculum manganireducens]|uniref:Uncharacterized protein n=1 Tax=Labilibaculum manganireducens TaxID=1940525 RepID=A0A2N3IA29_9BACT|nr:hypothetical protein BZG01_08795 [Labilibaculum manganireducens]
MIFIWLKFIMWAQYEFVIGHKYKKISSLFFEFKLKTAILNLRKKPIFLSTKKPRQYRGILF